jgi:hypothetical protein
MAFAIRPYRRFPQCYPVAYYAGRSRWRLLLLVWLIPWMTTASLFHLHLPDLTDRWSVLHSGGAHTVWTPDLPGEYAPPSYDRQREPSAHFAPRVVNSPELGIVLFGELATTWNALTGLAALSHFRAPSLIPLFALAFAASRAPPGSVCV